MATIASRPRITNGMRLGRAAGAGVAAAPAGRGTLMGEPSAGNGGVAAAPAPPGAGGAGATLDGRSVVALMGDSSGILRTSMQVARDPGRACQRHAPRGEREA